MPYDHHLLSDLARISWLLLYPHHLVGIFGGIIFNHINWKQVIYSTSSALSVAPSVCNTALACYVFLIFCSKLGFNKHLKEAEPIFWGKFFFFFFYLLCPKWASSSFFGCKKSNTFELFSESAHQIFLKLYMMTGSKSWFTVTVLDFQDNSYCA